MSDKKCPCCGATIDFNSTECRYCGEVINVNNTNYQNRQYQNTQYQAPEVEVLYEPTGVPIKSKSKIVAGVLAILLGGLGIHKFYLGRTGRGVLYLLFCWTYIPSIIGFIEGIIYLTASDEKFYNKYVKKY